MHKNKYKNVLTLAIKYPDFCSKIDKKTALGHLKY